VIDDLPGDGVQCPILMSAILVDCNQNIPATAQAIRSQGKAYIVPSNDINSANNKVLDHVAESLAKIRYTYTLAPAVSLIMSTNLVSSSYQYTLQTEWTILQHSQY
jgi:hypothetical protein